MIRYGKDAPNWKGGLSKFTCCLCGKLFETWRSKKPKYCSRSCKHVGSLKKLSREEALQTLNRLRTSPLVVAQFARQMGASSFQLKKMLCEHFPGAYDEIMEQKKLEWVEVYKRGRDFEYEVRGDLLRRGFLTMVSPRSEGPADLMSVSDGNVWLVQCKLSGQLRKKGRDRLIRLSKKCRAVPVLALKEDRKIKYFGLSSMGSAKYLEVDPYGIVNG